MLMTGKVVIVTGGARGIGEAYSRAFAKAGAKVAIAARSEKKAQQRVDQIRADGGTAIAVKTDLAVEEDIKNLVKEEFEKTINIDLIAVFKLCREVFPYMCEKGGRIVNVASRVVFTGYPKDGKAHYVAAKAGIIGLTRQMAKEAGKYNVNVNCIVPGVVTSDGMMAAFGEEAVKQMCAGHAIPELVKPEDLAGAALFFCSEHSKMITGQTLVIDGGKYFR